MTNDDIITTLSDGFVTAETAETPDFGGGYDAAMSGPRVKAIRLWFNPVEDPDDQFDSESDPWPEREPTGFDLSVDQAVKLARRLLQLAGEV